MIRHSLLLIGLCSLVTSAACAANRPNIILFLIDDQDQGSVGAFGGDTYTPNLDRMATEGMKFTHAYVSSAVCTPSRYGFATGRFAGNSTSKLYNDACGGPDQQGHPNFNMALERDRMNVGNVLREAGYTTVRRLNSSDPMHLDPFQRFIDRIDRTDRSTINPKEPLREFCARIVWVSLQGFINLPNSIDDGYAILRIKPR